MNKQKSQFLIACIAGAEEIGLNLYLYGFGNEQNRRWIIVDYGIGFDVRKYLGAQFITIDPYCLGEILDHIEAVIITHAHEDHIGAVLYLMQNLNIPIYVTPFAKAMLLEKIYEFGNAEPNIKIMRNKQKIVLKQKYGQNDNIEINPIAMPHSIPETMALLISYQGRNILHTSDFCFEKLQENDYQGFDQFLKQARPLNCNIDILLCDTTGILTQEQQISETEVRVNLEKIFAEAKTRIFVTCFSSNINRIISLYEAAQKTNRKFFVIGKAMHRAIRAAENAGIWKFEQPQDMYQTKAQNNIPNNCVVLISGCQGEYNAAMTKFANGINKKIKIKPNDLILFSARVIPGNEIDIATVQNELVKQGAEVITNNNFKIHSGGHANQQQISFFLKKIKPKILIPVHGEPRHTKKAMQIAEKIGIKTILVKNGQVLQWTNKQKSPKKIAEIKIKFLVYDGNQLVKAEDQAYKERKKIANSGYINIIIVKNENLSKIKQIKIITKGIPEKIIEKLKIYNLIKNLLRNIEQETELIDEYIQQYLNKAVRKTITEIWGKKPLCDTVLIEHK